MYTYIHVLLYSQDLDTLGSQGTHPLLLCRWLSVSYISFFSLKSSSRSYTSFSAERHGGSGHDGGGEEQQQQQHRVRGGGGEGGGAGEAEGDLRSRFTSLVEFANFSFSEKVKQCRM